MIYKSFQDIKLSALGVGCMRLPLTSDKYTDIDKEQTAQMVKYALENGVNYFDTAWGYHDGMSEPVMGEILKSYPRDSFYLATKFPGYDLSNMPKIKEIFEEQLKRLQVEYFDFYLFHNVCEMNINAYLDGQYGIYDYLIEQKKNGRIKHLGFSCHGNYDVLERFLNAYGKDMEFCQLQLNYLDYSFQKCEPKLELLKKHNIPVWVMEPVRGGKLADLGKHNEKLVSARPDESVVAWAFRYLQTLPDVVVTLSGMSSFEQLKENIKTYSEEKPLNKKELEILNEIVREMLGAKTVPCTACRYCTSHCPQELNIPELLALYNEHNFTGGGFLAPMALSAIDESKQPTACIGCKSCEAVCPQQIKISETLAEFSKILDK